MRRFFLFLICTILLAGLLRPAAADSPWLYGIHWYGDGNLSDVEAMTGDKPIWTLETVIVYSDPWWQLSGQAAHFQQIHAKGHSIIIRLEPNWGQTIPATQAERTQYINDLVATVEAAKDYCHIWQIGNEMNLYAEYGGDVLTAADYISFYKDARAAIKNVTSPLGEQIVLVGPVSPGAYFNEVRHTDGLVYLRQMCQALGPDDTDGFALHAYGAPWLGPQDAASDFMSGVSSQLQVIDEEGFCDKPAYITEWNRQTNPANDANQEAQTAQFLQLAYQRLHEWNSNPNNHPVVCACWFIYKNDPGWANFSLRYLKDVNPRGADADVWDAFQAVCGQNYPAGDSTPDPCDTRPPDPTPVPVDPIIERDKKPDPTSLIYTPSDQDAINGQLGTMIVGGFHPAVTNDADKAPAFTDGAGLGGLTGLLRDFPGAGVPAWSGFWTLPDGANKGISIIRVYTGNNGKDGRVYQYYDVYVTDDPQPSTSSTWTLLLEGVRSANLGEINNDQYAATMTSVTNSAGGNLVDGATAVRFDFFACSDTNKVFIDPFDSGSSRDEDGASAAYVSPLMYEVDVFLEDAAPQGGRTWMLIR